MVFSRIQMLIIASCLLASAGGCNRCCRPFRLFPCRPVARCGEVQCGAAQQCGGGRQTGVRVRPFRQDTSSMPVDPNARLKPPHARFHPVPIRPVFLMGEIRQAEPVREEAPPRPARFLPGPAGEIPSPADTARDTSLRLKTIKRQRPSADTVGWFFEP
jgi:hypothetical protein